jgi:hypothetical protein
MRHLLLLAAAGLCLGGCGPAYGRRVPDDLLKKLPYESRIDLLEAENNLAVAIDRVDESENEVQRARENIRRAKERRSAADDEVGKATDDVSREVAKLAEDEADARVDYLKARQKMNVRNVDIEKLSLRCAFAEFEVARLQVARKAKVEGSEKLSPEDFDLQVKTCKEDVAARHQDLKEQEQELAKAKDDWEQKKTALAKKTFDARASPYVE